ncbi:MAG TPA: response regulator [Thermoanaerobaculia bacterium]|jgi:CheY-like chemotaxis protein|nr:response regulator [Thermoanaerobaculia bacterium]
MAALEPSSLPASSSPLRVLVVEDDTESLELMGALLSLWGYEPRLTPDGPAGLRAATTEMPDVALLDIGLPGMDGFEVAQRLRSAPGGDSVLLVAVTAFRGESHRDKAFECGFDKYLMKPVDIETLRLVLAEAAPRTNGASHSALPS